MPKYIARYFGIIYLKKAMSQLCLYIFLDLSYCPNPE